MAIVWIIAVHKPLWKSNQWLAFSIISLRNTVGP